MGRCSGRSTMKTDFPFICECKNGFSGQDCSINGNKCGIYGDLDCEQVVNLKPVTLKPDQAQTQAGSFYAHSTETELTTPSSPHNSGNSVNWSSYVTLSLLVVLCVAVFSSLICYRRNSENELRPW